MTEDVRISLLGKFVNFEESQKLIKEKRNNYYFESIKPQFRDVYINDGWEIEREFNSSLKMKRLKSNDLAFEDEVWSLFALMGYTFLNKDRNFNLPYSKENLSLTKQIDVFAKDNETVIIVECKSSETNKRGDFKKEIESYQGIMDGLRKSIQSLFPSEKLKFKFILATKNLSISDEDMGRLSNIQGLHLTQENIDYFYDLHSQLGLASKYQFLGSVFDGQEIPGMDNKVPAVRGKMGGHTYYSFSIEPEKLLRIGYVLHRNKANVNMMPTYQRLIKKSRLKSIEDFIENEAGYFPNSIVISIDAKNCQFDQADTQVKSTISDVGILHLPKKYKSAYIIDGQHRLYGYSNTSYKNKNTIPVVAFVNLSREEQVKLFMQINENQKAVSKDLKETLKADLLWTSDRYDEQIDALTSRIAIQLGENRNSPLFGKVSIGQDKGIITIQNIKLALKKSKYIGKVSKSKIEELGLVYNGDLDYTCEWLNDFFSKSIYYFSSSLQEEWDSDNSIVLTNNSIYGLIIVLSDILVYLNENQVIDIKRTKINQIILEIQTYLDPIIIYFKTIKSEDRDVLSKSYGAPGQNKFWRLFQQIVRLTHSKFNPEGLDEYLKKQEREYNDKAFSIIREIETYFKKDFRLKLEEFFGKKWFEKGVPPKIADKAIVDALTKNRLLEDEEKEVEHWDCLTIIAYREIAMKNWRKVFEKDYTMPGDEKLSGGADGKTKWMVKLEHLRNQNFHSYYVSEDELSFLEQLNDWLIKKEVRNKFQIEKSI
jgi:DNA sulfur modification protein DndB